MTTEIYDFENQPTALPSGFQAGLGAVTTNASTPKVWSNYGIDNVVAYSGNKSFSLSGNKSTNTWYYIYKQMLTNYDDIYVSYVVKGNNISQEDDQLQDCYLGFMFTDSSGNKTFKNNPYNGTFDWSPGELRLSSAELKSIRDSGSRVDFVIFLDMSGQLWIDDLKFEFTSLNP